MKLSQPLRVDYRPGDYSFVTRRFVNSQLCYCNNPNLEFRVLGSLGKYCDKFNVSLYGFVIFGSHDHGLMEFRNGTKSKFFKDLGARTAEAVKKTIPTFGRGSVFERRPDEQAVPDQDMLDRFFYLVLQPIKAGLCRDISEYPSYNCFEDAITGRSKRVEFFKGSEYLTKKLSTKAYVDPAEFTEIFYLDYKRLPGLENLTQVEYEEFMRAEYVRRRDEIVEAFNLSGYVWPSVKRLRSFKCTSRAKKPKTSTRTSKRPLVLTSCLERKNQFLNWYFSILVAFKKASSRYLSGDRLVVFPAGTHRPPGPYNWAT